MVSPDEREAYIRGATQAYLQALIDAGRSCITEPSLFHILEEEAENKGYRLEVNKPSVNLIFRKIENG